MKVKRSLYKIHGGLMGQEKCIVLIKFHTEYLISSNKICVTQVRKTMFLPLKHLPKHPTKETEIEKKKLAYARCCLLLCLEVYKLLYSMCRLAGILGF